MTDQKIIDNILGGNRNKAIKELYKEFPKVRAAVCSNGGTIDEAREVFHDSLVLLIEKIEKEEFTLSAKLSTYLYSVNHFLWRNIQRKKQNNKELNWDDSIQIEADDLGYDEEKEQLFKQLNLVMEKISEKCQKIFKLFYFQKKKMDVIAKELEFSSVNSAKTQKYKCMERAIKLGKELLKETTNTVGL